jgi:T5SS/PEP-CTERM-associated repeat protein
MKHKCKNSISLIVLFLVVALARQAGATVRTWDNGGGNNDWFTAANWNPNGSPASTDNLTINSGTPATASGVYTSDGGSITFNNSGTTGSLSYLYTGYTGIGTLDIKNGADVTSTYSFIGYLGGSTGITTVEGSGSTWSTGSYYLDIGYLGTGTLNIKTGADVTTATSYIGNGSGSTGTVNVNGSGSTWSTGTYDLITGYFGTGTINITNNADVTSSAGLIGYNSGSTGTANIDGDGSTWSLGNNSLYVGYSDYAAATLNISNDAQVTTTGTLDIGAKGTVNLSGGKLSAGYLSGQADSLNFTGGELEITSGSVAISGTSPLGSYLNMTSGQLLDVQNGITTVASGSTLYVNNGRLNSLYVQNDGYLSIGNGGQVATTIGLTNSSSMSMSGGTIIDGTVTNDYGASFYASGKVNNALDNYGTIDLDDVLTVGGAMDNYGSVNIYTSDMLRQNGGLDNYGTIDLDGGSITGDGMIANYGIIRGGSAIGSPIINDGGLIHANGASTLLISNMSSNFNGGEMKVDDGAGINVLSPLFNEGTIVLNGSNATFSGGQISNMGTILGQGRVSNQVDNDGIVRASGGTLTLAGHGSINHIFGRIEALNDSTVFVSQGLNNNEGTITLQGGSFDNANHFITNNGSITGYGTFRSGELNNIGHWPCYKRWHLRYTGRLNRYFLQRCHWFWHIWRHRNCYVPRCPQPGQQPRHYEL